MGRPIKKKWFGDPDLPGYQLIITAKLPDEAVGDGYIIEQKGTAKYKVDVNGVMGMVKLVDKTTAGALLDNEAFILARPATGDPAGADDKAVKKLFQYQVKVYDEGYAKTYNWTLDSTQADDYTVTLNPTKTQVTAAAEPPAPEVAVSSTVTSKPKSTKVEPKAKSNFKPLASKTESKPEPETKSD